TVQASRARPPQLCAHTVLMILSLDIPRVSSGTSVRATVAVISLRERALPRDVFRRSYLRQRLQLPKESRLPNQRAANLSHSPPTFRSCGDRRPPLFSLQRRTP